jgi:DNA-binding transcriptional MerR regulator
VDAVKGQPVQISELSRLSGVSIPSIKFYVREGLLPAGVPTATNRSAYGEHHLRRLRLIRALIDVGELPIARVRAVLGSVDSSTDSLHAAFGSVMHGLDHGRTDADEPTLAAVQAWVERRGWSVASDAPAIAALAHGIETLNLFGIPSSISDFDAAADVAEHGARTEVAFARAMSDRIAAVETMMIGTVVVERALTEIRRLALEAVSAQLEAAASADASAGPG